MDVADLQLNQQSVFKGGKAVFSNLGRRNLGLLHDRIEVAMEELLLSCCGWSSVVLPLSLTQKGPNLCNLHLP